jgi:hypothetical protein
MTTFTKHIAALIPADQAEVIEATLEQHSTPMGERLFGIQPTHVDEAGREFIFVYTPARESFAEQALALAEAFPDVSLTIAGELVRTRDLDGAPTIWRAKKVSMKELVSMATILDGMTPIEVEEGYTSPLLELVNTGAAEEIQALSGVGPTLATRIIEARPIGSYEELIAIQGISTSMVEGWQL